MTQAVETDLVAEVRRVLKESPEPLTLSKIRALLPAPYRGMSLEDLAEQLRRQAAANVVIPYPKYRSQQDRYWDRPMAVHVAELLRATLQERPLAWSELRRKLPAYALGQAEEVLQDLLARGEVYRHPRTEPRGRERFGVRPPDPRDYLRAELSAMFRRLEQLGFTQEQLRLGAFDVLQQEEWAATPSPEERRELPAPAAAAAPAEPFPVPQESSPAAPGHEGTPS